jgi:hypothetical protein
MAQVSKCHKLRGSTWLHQVSNNYGQQIFGIQAMKLVYALLLILCNAQGALYLFARILGGQKLGRW